MSGANNQLRNANSHIDALNSKISAQKLVVDHIKTQSDKTVDYDPSNYLVLAPSEETTLHQPVYSGSILEIYGFDGILEIKYGQNTYRIPEWDGRQPSQLAINGPSGEGFIIRIRNNSIKNVEGKIIIRSSPRSRSPYSSAPEN